MTENEVVIYGASDDLVEVDEGSGVTFEPEGFDGETNGELTQMCLVGDAGQLRVRVRYGDMGCWGIEVAPVDEGVPMLPVMIGLNDRGYSARAVVQGVRRVVYELCDGEPLEALDDEG